MKAPAFALVMRFQENKYHTGADIVNTPGDGNGNYSFTNHGYIPPQGGAVNSEPPEFYGKPWNASVSGIAAMYVRYPSNDSAGSGWAI